MYRHEIGDVVTSRINSGKIKLGDVGVIIDFTDYPGEGYPWIMETLDGRRAAFNGFELAKEDEDV
jgi:hypothetical protein